MLFDESVRWLRLRDEIMASASLGTFYENELILRAYLLQRMYNLKYLRSPRSLPCLCQWRHDVEGIQLANRYDILVREHHRPSAASHQSRHCCYCGRLARTILSIASISKATSIESEIHISKNLLYSMCVLCPFNDRPLDLVPCQRLLRYPSYDHI